MTGMRTTFHDTDIRTDYDKEIQASRDRMEKQNPIERVAEIELLIGKLKIMSGLCWSRLPEGFNFGIAVPHRARINRRIDAFENEKTVHILERDEYLRLEGK